MERAVELGWLTRDMVARQAERRPDALAISDLASGRRLNFAELDDLVRRADGWLRGCGLPSGARVAILARNGLHHAALFYGCPRAATVTSDGAGRLWALDRAIFRFMVAATRESQLAEIVRGLR